MIIVIYLLLVIALVYLIYIMINKNMEHYLFPYEYPPCVTLPIIQYWNMPLRSTRNMSYDLRGDPGPNPIMNVGPWLNSTIY